MQTNTQTSPVSSQGDTPLPSASFMNDFRWWRVLVIMLAALPAYLILLLIERYGLNMPWYDEWYTAVYFYNHWGTLSFHDFWQLYNQHRAPLVKVLNVLILHLSNVDFRVTMLIGWLLILVALGSAFLMFRAHNRSPLRIIALLPFSLLLFSVLQWPNWIMGVMLATWLAVFAIFATLAIVTALSPGWQTLLLASIPAYIGSLSLFPGNLIWPTIIVVMWLLGWRKWRYYVGWVVLALLVLVPYVLDFFAFARVRIATDPGDIARFTILLIGAPISFGEKVAGGTATLSIGLIGLIAAPILIVSVGRCVEDGWRKAAPWIGLLGWSCAVAVSAAFGRAAQVGVLEAQSDRYLAYGISFWLALTALCLLLLMEPGRPNIVHRLQMVLLRLLPVGMMTVIGIGYMNGLIRVAGIFDTTNRTLAETYECLQIFADTPDDCLSTHVPAPDFTRSELKLLIAKNVGMVQGWQFSLSRAQKVSAGQDGVSYQMRDLDGVQTRVLFEHPNATLTWTLSIPSGRSIRLLTGAMVDTPTKYDLAPSDGVLYRVTLQTTGNQLRELYSVLIPPRKPGQVWVPIQIDLTPYAGQSIQLTLETRAGLNDQATANYDWALWLPPYLSVDGD